MINTMEQNISGMNDHDLIITIHEQIKNVRTDIKDIKDGTAGRLKDLELRLDELEKRLRVNESFIQNWTGRNLVIGIVLMFIIGLIGNYVSSIFKP